MANTDKVDTYLERTTETATDYAAQAADKIKSVAKEAYDDPQRFLRDTQDDLTKRAQDTPLKTLAIAAGLGFIVGAIWKR